MTFNEMNTIENALRDHLVGRPVSEQTGMVAEETAEYIAGSQDLKWKYVHSEGKTFYYGSIGARFKNWAPWHSTEDRDKAAKNLNHETIFTTGNEMVNFQVFFPPFEKIFTVYSFGRQLTACL